MNERSTEKEIMDLGPDFYTAQEYADCLRKLFRINQWFGFFYSTRMVLKRFSKNISLLDIGCGGGLFLLNLIRYYPTMRMRGIDVSATAIEQANQARIAQGIDTQQVEFQLQPELTLQLPPNSVDVVLITLVCHHVDDDDLVVLLQQVEQAARQAVIINDLHRHPIAYWVYKIISPGLFRNRLISHDGLVSIQRSFKRCELQRLLQRANITRYSIQWQFPFRWQVILWKN